MKNSTKDLLTFIIIMSAIILIIGFFIYAFHRDNEMIKNIQTDRLQQCQKFYPETIGINRDYFGTIEKITCYGRQEVLGYINLAR